MFQPWVSDNRTEFKSTYSKPKQLQIGGEVMDKDYNFCCLVCGRRAIVKDSGGYLMDRDVYYECTCLHEVELQNDGNFAMTRTFLEKQMSIN